jgi:hypothetical protein
MVKEMAKLTRRRFAFWFGFGLFSLSEKFNIASLDGLAAAAMRRTQSSNGNYNSNRMTNSNSSPAVESAPQEHWIADEDDTWRWFERENYVNGKWRLSGTTIPVNKQTGERKSDSEVYLEDELVPAEMRSAKQAGVIQASHVETTGDGSSASEDHPEFNKQLPSAVIRHRSGRPPSEWLRSLDAEEIRIWLKTIEVPNTGVNGMTHWTHLTRDHMFAAAKIEGLTIPEQSKLHSAAHFGY